ncbi:hypothetical protein [Streptomyces sp. TRM68367]|uniref:hypothetical protein n=1 Tax=Streptomyces sp. TRM68367 TaxID=2758415 RepID=UPI0021CF887E|nr:hypothetical protein [Streptomyces sp. TRM68367]
MVRRKMEGDEQQRAAAAREAHRAGEAPSARSVTTGASKQRAHRGCAPHEERIAARHRGKQQWRPGDPAQREGRGRTAPDTEPTFAGRQPPDYTDRHEQVFRSLSGAQERHGGEAVHLDEIARASGLPPDETRTLLHDWPRSTAW